MLYVIGIDPGGHGAIAFTSLDGTKRAVYAFNDNTEHDVKGIIQYYKNFLGVELKAYIEEVHAMPKDGKVQAFSFGKNYGFWLGLLTALDVPYYPVIPLKWQNGLRLKLRKLEYKQKKNALKGHAQRLFPMLSPTLDTADALLIAEFGRQITIAERKAAR